MANDVCITMVDVQKLCQSRPDIKLLLQLLSYERAVEERDSLIDAMMPEEVHDAE